MINEEDAIFPANLDMMYACFYFKYDGTELLIRQVVKGIFPQTINANHLTGGGQKECFFMFCRKESGIEKLWKFSIHVINDESITAANIANDFSAVNTPPIRLT